jgi:type VI secretion system protein ImpB
MKPHLQFSVENKLSEDPNAGKLGIDLNFRSMDDFTPEAVARKVEPLRRLLEAREKLSHLLTYMDGKDSAEELIGKLLNDKALQQALAGGAKPAADAAG